MDGMVACHPVDLRTSEIAPVGNLAGLEFYKMSGSGNDFVFLDGRDPRSSAVTADVIPRICARATGVGSDGVVFLEPHDSALFRMRYHNRDGSRAEMCGNAALCSVRLATELGIAKRGVEFEFETDSGRVRGVWRDAEPEIELAQVTEVHAEARGIDRITGEERIGFARAGVPHLVIACPDVAAADVGGRGAELRRHRSLRDGANVDFVSRTDRGWRYRTFERGVEAETLACGTGAVATAILLSAWGLAEAPVDLQTSSGEHLRVGLTKSGSTWTPRLSGPARLVFRGRLEEL